jgi:hypothetical protein
MAFYAAGGFLFVLASVPLPTYGLATVIATLAGGGFAYAALVVRERGRSLKPARDWVVSVPGAALVLGTLALLAFEISPIAGHPFPNTWDGSATALWVNLTLANHSVPWTLSPFAQAGVTYPMGTTVWMTIPVLILGWSVITVPLLLPPLFLSLSVPAAFCWGSRLAADWGRQSEFVALLFAGFFGLVASWPRLLVGGYYDFVFALPLLLVLFGMVLPLAERPPAPWRMVIALGLAGGVLSSLSPVATQALLLVLVGYLLAFRPWSFGELSSWLARFVALIAFDAVCLLRSLVGALTWFSYPGHVLVQTGPAGYSPPSTFGPLGQRLIVGDLDPFAPVKFRMSPFPIMSLELQVLLVGALGLAALAYFARSERWTDLWPRRFVASLLVATAVLFALTTVSLLADIPGTLSGFLGAVTNFDEASFLLFLCLQALGTVPLVALATVLRREWSERKSRSTSSPETESPPPGRSRSRGFSRPPAAKSVVVLAVLLLAVPFATGAILTGTQASNFIYQEVTKTSNVTVSDQDALEWAGQHLASCSAVLVAPGSAAQFLPEFVTAHLVYQMNPTPWNATYFEVVQNLTEGQYSSETRAGLLSLGVTVVFVTGQSSVTYPAMDAAPLVSSSDFSQLFSEGDASIFAFLPGISVTGCQP